MEIGRPETPVSVSVGQPPREQQDAPEVWRSRDFYKYLASPLEFAYNELPHTIHLDEKWHALMGRLMTAMTQHNREYSVATACLDRTAPLRSKPFDIDLFFQEQWGDDDTPVFISNTAIGTKSHAETCSLPAAIEWQGKTVAMRRTGFIHTHPYDLPFSDGDFMWFTDRGQYRQKEKFLAAVSKSHTYVLLYTDAVPSDAHDRIQKAHKKQRFGNWLHFQVHPRRALLERNKQYAMDCKLGLYQGKPGAPLMRLV